MSEGQGRSGGSPNASPFLSNEEAASFLNLSPRTLEKMRVVGGGPPFCKFGRRVAYAVGDLEAWAANRRCNSTSDPACKGP
ncbi:helix-turn-helix domain-containing protein [Sphingomonadaceae bacterium G21617-S1]|nr:helix-turn-helix domain-containing protein [Sphingomonadaceae bacterium G21617-S1]